jgi:nitrous oxide reductase accessory protein NosL
MTNRSADGLLHQLLLLAALSLLLAGCERAPPPAAPAPAAAAQVAAGIFLAASNFLVA